MVIGSMESDNTVFKPSSIGTSADPRSLCSMRRENQTRRADGISRAFVRVGSLCAQIMFQISIERQRSRG